MAISPAPLKDDAILGLLQVHFKPTARAAYSIRHKRTLNFEPRNDEMMNVHHITD
jgi:hypothetical protein